MRLFAFVFWLLCFTFNCFAYDIEPYLKRPSLESKELSFSLIFCPLGYQDKEIFLKDIDALVQRLKKTKPFDEFMESIGIYYINLSEEEGNLFFKKTQVFPPLKVRQDFLDDILSYLKLNYKLIILDAGGSVSCAELSSPDKTSLIILGKARYKDKDSFAKGFLHELGHSLGLRDECVDCVQLSLAGPPNCAPTKEEAQRWWGDLVGKVARVNYIRGCCGNKDYIRPIIASFMNDADKAEDFGSVNERYLRQIYNNPIQK
jgi:hypothetical protein